MGVYRRPADLADALHLLAAAPCRILAGGTDLYPADVVAKAWATPGLDRVDLLDVTGLADLRGIAAGPNGIRFGAAVTWSEVLRAPLPPAFDGLKAAAREVGGRQIQNRGTLGGNLCNASPAADGVPPLLTLDAEVELASLRGRRRLPLAAFVLGNRRTALEPDELLFALHLPPPPAGTLGRFLKLGARRYLVISIAMVALVVAVDEAGCIAEARVAVGACSSGATRLVALEADLVGIPAVDAPRLVGARHLADLAPIDDVRASAAYRLEAARTLVARGLEGLVRSDLAA
jgi:CO/xanthine dehydrogenase FAD-binding subunit